MMDSTNTNSNDNGVSSNSTGNGVSGTNSQEALKDGGTGGISVAGTGGKGMLKIGVLVSGGGSNLQAIIDEIAQGRLNAKIVEVVSSRPDAYGLQRAKAARIPTCSLNREIYENPQVADSFIASELKRAGAEYVVMAGYMRKVGKALLESFPDRIVNLHPALLPSFPGAHGIEDALAAGVKVTGVTVHFANEEYDKGPIIAQYAISVAEGEALETLVEKIHAVEHKMLPEVLRWIAAGWVRVGEDRKVYIDWPAEEEGRSRPAAEERRRVRRRRIVTDRRNDKG